MLRQPLSVAILSLLIAGSLPTCSKSGETSPTDTSSDPCKPSEEQLNAERLLIDNYALQREVESLKQSLEAERAKNQASKNREQEKTEARDKESKRAQLESQKQIERQQMRTIFQSASVSLKEVRKLLEHQNKSEVLYMLGEPNHKTMPVTTDAFFYEIWEYNGKIQEGAKSPKQSLFVFFDGDLVNKLESSNK